MIILRKKNIIRRDSGYWRTMIKLTIKQTFCSYNTEKGSPPSLMKVSLKVRKKYRLPQSRSEGNHWGGSSLVKQLFCMYKALRQVSDRKGRKEEKKEGMKTTDRHIDFLNL